jgi:hypothetical protein
MIGMHKPLTRVLYVLGEYPQISHTYIQTEIHAVRNHYDVRVVAMAKPNLAYEHAYPHEQVDKQRVSEVIEEFRPHVLHTHYLLHSRMLRRLSRRHQVPFTIRAHSFDLLKPMSTFKMWRRIRPLNNDLCLGVLTFPFTRPLLERVGCRPDKIVDCYPVIDYDRFHDVSLRSDAVMNVGACTAKKKMEDYIDLARSMPGRQFDLYPLGYATDKIRQYNDDQGLPVDISRVIQPEDMPAVYNHHGWLVYTGCFDLRSVGWPMAVAEAQAAGLGVCMPNLRPDIAQYVGGAGFIYDSIAELPDILSRPYSEEMRERGFEHAKQSDIQRHKHLLTDLWDKTAEQARPKP